LPLPIPNPENQICNHTDPTSALILTLSCSNLWLGGF